MQTNMEQIFTFIDQESTFIEEQENATYLEGVIYSLELWLSDKKAPVLNNPDKEEIRKGIQLAILKGMKKAVQVNHQMTPDAIGLISKLFCQRNDKGQKRTFDFRSSFRYR